MNLVLTGKIQSGKSTFLRDNLSKERSIRSYLRLNNYFYIYPEGLKYQYFISENGIRVGKYFINPEIFEMVKRDWRENKDRFSFLILDEVGKLEIFEKKGFFEIYVEILRSQKNNLVVVRESLLLEFLKKFREYEFKICYFKKEKKEKLKDNLQKILLK